MSSVSTTGSAEQYYKLKKLLQELEQKKGRHTELVTVYIPAGFSLNEINNLLASEISLTQNVKSKTVRKNVIDALTKITQHLKLYKQTPEHGLAIFCGNVSGQEGKTDIKIWAIEPPEPLTAKMYWCDQLFELEPLRQQLKEKEVYGLIALDLKEASVGLLKGKSIEILRHLESIVPGKQIKGGQSAMRYQRVREGLINDWFKEIAETIKASFAGHELKGILLGGPGITKEDFYNGGYLETDLKKQVLGLQNIGYTNEQGLEELVNRSSELLKEAAVSREKELCNKFFSELQKDSGSVTYGLVAVLRALTSGSVETILLSECIGYEEVGLECACGFNEKRFVKTEEKENQVCPKCGQRLKLFAEQDAIDAMQELAKNYGSKVEIISCETSEGKQLLALGGIAAILRWKSK